jgi:hypothetical protein
VIRPARPDRLEAGLLADGEGHWWAAPAERPKLLPLRDERIQADADVYQYRSGSRASSPPFGTHP